MSIKINVLLETGGIIIINGYVSKSNRHTEIHASAPTKHKQINRMKTECLSTFHILLIYLILWNITQFWWFDFDIDHRSQLNHLLFSKYIFISKYRLLYHWICFFTSDVLNEAAVCGKIILEMAHCASKKRYIVDPMIIWLIHS